MTELEQQLQSARAEAEGALAACAELSALDQLKAKYLEAQRRGVGRTPNNLAESFRKKKSRASVNSPMRSKNALTAAIAAKREELEAKGHDVGSADRNIDFAGDDDITSVNFASIDTGV